MKARLQGIAFIFIYKKDSTIGPLDIYTDGKVLVGYGQANNTKERNIMQQILMEVEAISEMDLISFFVSSKDLKNWIFNYK